MIKPTQNIEDVTKKHAELAESFQKTCAKLLPKINGAAKNIDWDYLAENDPKTLITILKDMNTITIASIKMQRESLALSTAKIEIESRSQTKMEISNVDLKDLSDKELTDLYFEKCNAKYHE